MTNKKISCFPIKETSEMTEDLQAIKPHDKLPDSAPRRRVILTK